MEGGLCPRRRPPQALATLAAKGRGQLVYNADEFRYSSYFRRVPDRFAPHNLYSNLANLRSCPPPSGRARPARAEVEVRPDILEQRPQGGSITVSYPANTITYRYNRKANTYRRTVSVEGEQRDASNGKRIAPKNVVVMLVNFSPLNDGSGKNRQEADIIGSGKAWIATNGTTIKGTWKKNKPNGMTHFYDANGKRVTLTVGQTFIQVLDIGSKVTIKKGKAPPAITPAAPPRRRHRVRVGADLRVDPPGRGGDLGPSAARRPRARLAGDPRVHPPVGPGRLQRGCEPSRLARRDEDAGRPDELGEAPTADATIGVLQASASIAAKPAASDSTGRIAARAPRTRAASRASGRWGA